MKNHILVLEDDPQRSYLYTHILSRAGYCVDIAPSLEGAQRLMGENSYAFFVCDMQVQGGSCALLRSEWELLKHRGTRVILVSGQDRACSLPNDVDVDYFLSKPVSTHEIIRYIHRFTS